MIYLVNCLFNIIWIKFFLLGWEKFELLIPRIEKLLLSFTSKIKKTNFVLWKLVLCFCSKTFNKNINLDCESQICAVTDKTNIFLVLIFTNIWHSLILKVLDPYQTFSRWRTANTRSQVKCLIIAYATSCEEYNVFWPFFKSPFFCKLNSTLKLLHRISLNFL